MKGYKVVKALGDSYFSSCWWYDTGVEYNTRDMATPKVGDGPLCVFTDRLCALHWMRGRNTLNLQVWECEYAPSASLSVWRKDGEGYITRKYFNQMPAATVFADWVKLVKRVEE